MRTCGHITVLLVTCRHLTVFVVFRHNKDHWSFSTLQLFLQLLFYTIIFYYNCFDYSPFDTSNLLINSISNHINYSVYQTHCKSWTTHLLSSSIVERDNWSICDNFSRTDWIITLLIATFWYIQWRAARETKRCSTKLMVWYSSIMTKQTV